MPKDLKIEFKEINKDFSVFKCTGIVLGEEKTDYGLCFNTEIKDFVEKGIFPEQGSKYCFITKTEMDELVEYNFEEKDLDYDLEDYVYDNDKLFTFFDVLKKEKSFEKGYFLLVDGISGFVTEYYDKLSVPFPVHVEKRLNSTKYNLFRAEYLLSRRKDIKIDGEYNEDTEIYEIIRKSTNDKYINFYWFPDKKNWKLFIDKYKSSSYKETIKFLIEEILNVPLKTESLVEKRVEIKADLRIQGQTVRIDDTFGLYQYSYKVDGELFSYADICLVEEIPDFQKNLIIPNKITCNKDKLVDNNLEEYLIVKKEYLDKIKVSILDMPHNPRDTEYMVKPEYFMNLPTDIYFNNYVILKKMPNHLSFSYIDTRTSLPLMTPVRFEHCNSNPVNSFNYDLEKAEKILQEKDNIRIVGKSDFFIDFDYCPSSDDWKKMCDYINNKTELKCGMLLQHFLSIKDREDFLQFVLDEILKLPKGGKEND